MSEQDKTELRIPAKASTALKNSKIPGGSYYFAYSLHKRLRLSTIHYKGPLHAKLMYMVAFIFNLIYKLLTSL